MQWTVHTLRSRWKPTKERLSTSPDHEPILIRLHRCCSWMQRVEQIEADGVLDAVLIYRWIALNSLYGQWNEDTCEPVPDRFGLSNFMDRIMQLDADDRLPQVLQDHRDLVMSIFDDAYLTKYFWEDPSEYRARKTKKTKFDARTWYIEKKYSLILSRLLERIYLLRCQLVHGAATFGGQLNRSVLELCTDMLGQLLPAILLVIIDNGHNEDWGPLCYPPHV